MAVLLSEPEAWHPRVSAPATYPSGKPRNQHPAVARWLAHLRGLATAIHEIAGLEIIIHQLLPKEPTLRCG
jgi:hypothetical protein